MAAFAGYCQAYARWKEAEEFITLHGTIVKTPSGYWQQVPQVSIAQFASDLDKTTQRMLHQGARLTQILKQDQYSPMTFGQEVVSLFAGVNGYLDEVRLEDVGKYEKNLQEHLKADGRRILDKLEAEPVLTEDMHKRLTEFVGNFTRDFIENAKYDKPATD